MFIPGEIIAFLTFPGVVVHEIAHQLFCRIFRVSVFDVCYYRYGNPAGYVIHEPPRKPFHHVLIGVGPFLLNSFIGAIIAFPAAIPVLKFESGTLLDYFLIWVGVSIAMHSFPSKGDAESISVAISAEGTSKLLRFVTKPILFFINIGTYGSVIWLDLAYGIGIAMALPTILIWLYA
jgi:hypothetical protein